MTNFPYFDIIACTVSVETEGGFMSYKEDVYILEHIFQLSTYAVIRMVNRLFGTEYASDEQLWVEKSGMTILLTIAATNRYEFQVFRSDDAIQIQAEDRGCSFYHRNMAIDMVMQIKEPRIIYFGENTREETNLILEFPSKEKVHLPIHTITITDYSPESLEKTGLILFLPFLVYGFLRKKKEQENKKEALKYFLIRDIVGTLNHSFQKGDLKVFDVQKLKQLCKRVAWKLLAHEGWMKDLEMQSLFVEILDTDFDLLERMYCIELQNQEMKLG